MLTLNESFTCSRSMPSLVSDHFYCAAFGGGCEQCDGKSPTCRIRARQLRRRELGVAFTNWLQKKRGIAPHTPTPVESFIDAINNFIPHCSPSKTDETAMERDVAQYRHVNRNLTGKRAGFAIVDELGKVMQEKSEGEGASWGDSQHDTDGSSMSATASETGTQTVDATVEG